jgi:hypothetical protein
MPLNLNINTLGAKGRGQQPQLSWTTTETGTFTGTIRMTQGDMRVSWGDGTSEIIADGDNNLTHDYGGLTGDKDIKITFLKGYKDVTEFDINNTNSKGDIANWQVYRFTSLQIFFIHNNSFTGVLSNWDISGLTSLQRLYIHGNSFTAAPVLTTNASFADGVIILIQSNTGIPASNVSNHIIGLDDYDGSNGSLNASGTNGGTMTYADLTAAAQTAHDNLVNTKGWSITLDI